MNCQPKSYTDLLAYQAERTRRLEAQRARDQQCPYCHGISRNYETAKGTVFCTSEFHRESGE